MSATSGNIGTGGPATGSRGTVVGRRLALRTAFTAAVLTATAAALAPLVRAGRSARRRTAEPPVPLFEETYRGRHIAAVRLPARSSDGTHAGGAADAVDIRIDGRPLPVMRRADGSWLSGINHYESFATPRDLARAAVDELGTARLAANPAHHG
ncbi:tyrosinase family oxidase copper chaperone [Streptomyces sp. NRRL S-87]|uniref:tyrosinase family oxidase copper chaperone n=1 Tax=Streptomyces sp. NRRL S-87 TaxID=1463920 RepID=UPI0004BF699E|nr:tyrosinase family oxidase copper chaperone [Streptomyces sp. NRRL S-87]